MKKMFITEMNTNEAKTYVEPQMKVIEVDVEELVAQSDKNDVEGDDMGVNDKDPYEKDVKGSSSVFDEIW